ncbi:MAG: prephenate dehydrogenase, partial [Calditrichaeota bacterium]
MGGPGTFAIIGGGRFGCFWGRHLSRHVPVWVYDVDESRREEAEAFGVWAPLQECLGKEVVVLTIPIRCIPGFLREHGRRIPPGTVVMDCASVKSVVMEWFEEFLPPEVYYVATHPLFGPDSAAGGLAGHTLTMIPGRIPYHRLAALNELFAHRLGLRLLSLSPDEHDRLMAYNLSLMHHLGRALHHLGIEQLPLKMASLQRAQHIARVAVNDSRELFEDFYRFNP